MYVWNHNARYGVAAFKRALHLVLLKRFKNDKKESPREGTTCDHAQAGGSEPAHMQLTKLQLSRCLMIVKISSVLKYQKHQTCQQFGCWKRWFLTVLSLRHANAQRHNVYIYADLCASVIERWNGSPEFLLFSFILRSRRIRVFVNCFLHANFA